MGTKNNVKTENKGKKVIITIVAVILAVVVIGLAVFNSVSGKGVLLRAKTAAQSDNYKLSGTQMAYFGGTVFQQYYSILSYFGADASVQLKDQPCSLLEDANATWFDYFMDQTKTQVEQILALCEYAHENGIELDAEDLSDVEENIKALGEAAAEYGRTADSYANAVFGNGVNTNDIREALKLYALANKATIAFSDSVDVSADAIEAYYAEHPDEFDGVDYYTYSISIAPEEDEEGEETEETAETTEKESQDTIAALTFISTLGNAGSVDEFKALVRSYEASLDPDADEDALDAKVDATFREHVVRSSVTVDEIAEWLFSAKPGEAYTYTDTDAGTYTAFVLAKEAYRDETKNRNVRHILIEADEENEDDSTKAQAILDELLAANFSEEKWNELAAEHSTDTGSNANGGLYEDMPHGQTYEEFNDWLFDEARKAGDSGIVKTSAGWHVMYYVGESDNTAWESAAKSSISEEEYNTMVEDHKGSIKFIDEVLKDITLN